MLKFGFNGLLEQSAKFSKSGPKAARVLAHSFVRTGSLNIKMFPMESGEALSLVSPKRTLEGRGFLIRNPLNNRLPLFSHNPSITIVIYKK